MRRHGHADRTGSDGDRPGRRRGGAWSDRGGDTQVSGPSLRGVARRVGTLGLSVTTIVGCASCAPASSATASITSPSPSSGPTATSAPTGAGLAMTDLCIAMAHPPAEALANANTPAEALAILGRF